MHLHAGADVRGVGLAINIGVFKIFTSSLEKSMTTPNADSSVYISTEKFPFYLSTLIRTKTNPMSLWLEHTKRCTRHGTKLSLSKHPTLSWQKTYWTTGV